MNRKLAGRSARSPKLSPLDYWFWSIVLTELGNPLTLWQSRKKTVEVFAESLDEDEVIDAVRHVRTRAHACMRHRGERLEGTLQDSCLMCSLYV